MLTLSTVSLLAIDAAHPFAALISLAESARWVRFSSITLLTDVRRHLGIASRALDLGVQVAHHSQTDVTASLEGIPRAFYPDYERAQLTRLLDHLGPGDTHALYMEADAAVLNADAWDDSWLDYDYIGAPWPRSFEPGYPVCNGATNAVGNGGFSLRSRRFLAAVRERFDTLPEGDESYLLSDAWTCRTLRPALEADGIKFAPLAVAARFSCENRIYSGQFGFHGRYTARLNGWGEWIGNSTR